MQDFHNRRVWHEANGLALSIRRLIGTFPKADYSSLRNQMVRSSESIPDAIAEGCGATTNAEFARFLAIAIKSSSELENQIERAHGYGLTRDREYRLLVGKVCDVRKMTWGLRKKVLGGRASPPPLPTLPSSSDDEQRMTNND